ncbi:MAG TPA: fumarylacetoacetate hydrolase family protein [Hyphomicrobiales bacterium]|nr:fumarylacetoacetate hydrolase family protein [Hyphomicrobiales bacterium]
MKLASFRVDGRDSYGAVVGQEIIDLGSRLGRYSDLKALIATGAFAEAEAEVKKGKPEHRLDAVTFLPVIPRPEKIFCVGLNYEEHRVESGREPTEKPAIFMRTANSQVGHRQPMIRPRESTDLDYEGEIAVIIGKGGRRISEADSWSHIAGYSCYNDGSVRDWQRHTAQWIPGKNWVATGGFGPWMVTADEIPAKTVLTLTTRLNGTVMQHASTDMMIHSIPRQIAYLSTFADLEPGDVIVTGTPGGVGTRRNPPVYMKDGDTVEIEVDKVGVLVNPVKAEK